MALHYSIPSMVQESLIEKLILSNQAIEYRKNPAYWGSSGCLGHPALTLLMSIADTVGSYVEGGNTRNHFNILDNKSYYNLGLGDKNITIIYEKYRNLQIHNSTISNNCGMDIDNRENLVFNSANGQPTVYLVPLFRVTVSVLNTFLPKANSVIESSKQFQTILKK